MSRRCQDDVLMLLTLSTLLTLLTMSRRCRDNVDVEMMSRWCRDSQQSWRCRDHVEKMSRRCRDDVKTMSRRCQDSWHSWRCQDDVDTLDTLDNVERMSRWCQDDVSTLSLPSTLSTLLTMFRWRLDNVETMSNRCRDSWHSWADVLTYLNNIWTSSRHHPNIVKSVKSVVSGTRLYIILVT